MKRFVIYWCLEEHEADSADEVEVFLDQLHAAFVAESQPTLVTVARSGTDSSLSVGLGTDLTVMTFEADRYNGPYYVSRGQEPDGGEELAFRFSNQSSYFSPANGVLLAAARKAMRSFCETGKLPNDIDWDGG